MGCIIRLKDVSGGKKMTGKQMIKLFKKSGWKVFRIQGSHYQMLKNGQKETIPHHTTELEKGFQKYFLKRLKEVV
jgi:predicted RNA binding protein YcfA (HicA-like mRNA interferase family)